MDINSLVSLKSRTEKDNNSDAHSKETASTADSQDTWHAIADNRKRPRYRTWLKDS
jgi:hypothetical protein